MMFKMNFNSKFKFYNNGFRCDNETSPQYENRLKLISNMLAQQRIANNVDIFCLQEAPQNKRDEEFFFRELRATIGKKFAIESSKGKVNGHYSLTAYNSNRFEKHNNITQSLSRIAYSGGFLRRVLPIALIDKNGNKEKHLILNVHANFKEQIKDDLELLLKEASRLGINYATIIGDFNRNLLIDTKDKQDNCKRVLAAAYKDGKTSGISIRTVKSTCVYFNDSGLEIQTRDGAIATEKLGEFNVTPLWNANQVEVLTGNLHERISNKTLLTSEIKSALTKSRQNDSEHLKKESPKRKIKNDKTQDEHIAKRTKKHSASGQPNNFPSFFENNVKTGLAKPPPKEQDCFLSHINKTHTNNGI